MLTAGNKVITASVTQILKTLNLETKGHYFSKIIDKGSEVLTCCPQHKDGMEKHPSFSICNNDDSGIIRGFGHCFTCGLNLPMEAIVGMVFGENDEFGAEWLAERFGDIFYQKSYILDPIVVDKKKYQYDREEILDQYSYFHPYMFKRKLTEEVVKKFRIGFNKDTNSITFPLRDTKGNLIGISSRDVSKKQFDFEMHYDHRKPVYLLDSVVRDGYSSTIVCESQIDALTAWSYGYVACAFMGSASDYQYGIINSCPIRSYVLMFDNDSSGVKATKSFEKKVRKDVFITPVSIPNPFKDINDMSKDEFEKLLEENGVRNLVKRKN